MTAPLRAAAVGLGAAAGALALAGCSVFGARTAEQPPYAVVDRLAGGAVEVREYGPRLAAEAALPGGDGFRARGEAFRALAAYIGGANRTRAEVDMTAPVEVAAGPGREIAMTAPVAIDGGAAGRPAAMRFFLPAALAPGTAPAPTDPRVRLVPVPPETVAALRFSGSTGAGEVARRTAELRRALEGSPWRAAGEPVALFYDPPWTLPFRRRNEVAVPVERR